MICVVCYLEFKGIRVIRAGVKVGMDASSAAKVSLIGIVVLQAPSSLLTGNIGLDGHATWVYEHNKVIGMNQIPWAQICFVFLLLVKTKNRSDLKGCSQHEVRCGWYLRRCLAPQTQDQQCHLFTSALRTRNATMKMIPEMSWPKRPSVPLDKQWNTCLDLGEI